jgi:hypothetical protein
LSGFLLEVKSWRKATSMKTFVSSNKEQRNVVGRDSGGSVFRNLSPLMRL